MPRAFFHALVGLGFISDLADFTAVCGDDADVNEFAEQILGTTRASVSFTYEITIFQLIMMVDIEKSCRLRRAFRNFFHLIFGGYWGLSDMLIYVSYHSQRHYT